LENLVLGLLVPAKIVVLALHHLELSFERNGVIGPSAGFPRGDKPADEKAQANAKGEANQDSSNCFVHVHSLPVTSDPHENLH
jgi:hypothetical protein